jgi:hypothetical protein
MIGTRPSFPLASFPLASFPLASFPLASFPPASFPLASFSLPPLPLVAAFLAFSVCCSAGPVLAKCQCGCIATDTGGTSLYFCDSPEITPQTEACPESSQCPLPGYSGVDQPKTTEPAGCSQIRVLSAMANGGDGNYHWKRVCKP